MGRQDTSTGLRSADHGIDEGNSGFIWLRISEKMRRGWAFRRIVRLPLTAMSYHGHASLLPQLGELGRAYLAARAALGAAPEWLFQLPGERRPLTRHMAGWVSETLDEEGVRAPAGFVYLGHSLRSGGSSAAEAIRVPRFRGNGSAAGLRMAGRASSTTWTRRCGRRPRPTSCSAGSWTDPTRRFHRRGSAAAALLTQRSPASRRASSLVTHAHGRMEIRARAPPHTHTHSIREPALAPPLVRPAHVGLLMPPASERPPRALGRLGMAYRFPGRSLALACG